MSKVHPLITAAPLSHDDIYAGLLPGFETEAEAQKRSNRKARRFLESKKAKERKAKRKQKRKLGKLLDKCVETHRCGSGGCDQCLRQVRMQIIPQASLKLWETARARKKEEGKNKPKEPFLYTASCVDHKLATSRGELEPEAIRRFTKRTRKAIERSDLGKAVIFGGIDFSLNFPEDDTEPKWFPHLNMVIAGVEESVIDNALRPMFPEEPGTPRPLEINKVTCLPSAVSYAYKSVFTRRLSYSGDNGRQQTRTVSLKLDETCELALLLDQLGIGGRLLLQGLKINGSRLISTRSLSSRN